VQSKSAITVKPKVIQSYLAHKNADNSQI